MNNAVKYWEFLKVFWEAQSKNTFGKKERVYEKFAFEVNSAFYS